MNRARKAIGTNVNIAIRCPGCGDMHVVPVTGPQAWGWNGSLERPTLTSSVLSRSGHYAPHFDPKTDECWCGKDYGFSCHICHSFVKDGRIEFLADCTHALAGCTVDLAEVEP